MLNPTLGEKSHKKNRGSSKGFVGAVRELPLLILLMIRGSKILAK